MNRKYLLFSASLIMILIGILRGGGSIALFVNGKTLNTEIPIIATNLQLTFVAIGLLAISALLIIAGINLLRNNLIRSWKFCWTILILFVLDGALNGYLLFGQPLEQGQLINLSTFFITGLFLIAGKPAINFSRSYYIQKN